MSASPPSVSELRRTAEEGARLCGQILAQRFAGARTIEFKGAIDLVTDADKASEAALLDFLHRRFPTHAVLAEESGRGGAPDSAYRWIADPLDGTTNYAHRVPHFCVSVAVEGPAGLLAGAIYDPLRDELFSAGRGEGATLNGVALAVSGAATLQRALLATGFPYDVRERPDPSVGLFNHLVVQAQGIRRMGSAALDLAYVACGRYDGYFEFTLKPWDLAAGALLVTEAGGRVSRIDGTALQLSQGDVLATAPGIENALKAECARYFDKVRQP